VSKDSRKWFEFATVTIGTMTCHCTGGLSAWSCIAADRSPPFDIRSPLTTCIDLSECCDWCVRGRRLWLLRIPRPATANHSSSQTRFHLTIARYLCNTRPTSFIFAAVHHIECIVTPRHCATYISYSSLHGSVRAVLFDAHTIALHHMLYVHAYNFESWELLKPVTIFVEGKWWKDNCSKNLILQR